MSKHGLDHYVIFNLDPLSHLANDVRVIMHEVDAYKKYQKILSYTLRFDTTLRNKD